jgi:hypothetical protein
MRFAMRFKPGFIAFVMVVWLPAIGHSETRMKDLLHAYQWFDTLEYPSVGRLPFVRINIRESIAGSEGPQDSHQYGFLMKQQDQTFTVFLPDLTVQTFHRASVGASSSKLAGFERLDLIQWSRNWLAASQQQPQPHTDRWAGFAGTLEPETQFFVVARACAARGHERLALQLFNGAENQSSTMVDEEKWGLRQRLSNRMARACIWRATLEFGNSDIGRISLLATFRQIGRRFSGDQRDLNVQPTVRLLERMVVEDQQHASSHRRPVGNHTSRKHIAELIYLLRDQNGHQYMQPGSCDVFADPRGDKSPAAQLVKMDIAAAPQLIEALSDRRFTRSVGFWRNFTFSHCVLRIGDAALAILERIACKRFYTRRSTSAEMTNDDSTSAVKAEIRRWWKEYQRRGEQSVLLAAVSRGDNNSSSQAQRLVERYPNAALPAIKEGIRHASEEWVRSNLIQTTSKLKGEAVTALLRDQMEHGVGVSVRVAAAFGVHERGGRDAVPRMIDEWHHYDGIGSGLMFTDPLISFLTSSGSPVAMEAVGRDLIKRPILARLNVVSALMGGSYREVMKRRASERQMAVDLRDQALVEKWAEEILAHELMDTDEEEGLAMGGEVSFRDPRLCELSAYGLSLLWPNRYQFKNGGSLFVRDYQRISLYNIWLQENGKPPVALPERPKIDPLPVEVMTPALNRVLAATSASSRETALRATEQMGLPALPAVIQALHTIEPASPARAELERLAAHLACIVRKIEADSNLKELSGTISTELENMRARPLTATDLTRLLRHTANKLHSKWTGVVLTANRDNDGCGFVVRLDVLPGALDPPTSSTSWNYWQRVLVGEETVYGMSGSGSYKKEPGHGPSDGVDLQELTDAIRKSVASPPLESVSISVRLIRKQ